ncbi:MAG: hypothetical protein VX265_13575 [Myxococcota bacterium]|nr:hypothetical protein [Myxococcota bacterium]
MRIPALALTLAFATPVVLSGCGPKTNLKREDKEQTLLDDSTRLYWEAYRWGDEERAGAFIEASGDRVLFKDWFIEHKDAHKIEEVIILQVVMTTELEEPEDGKLRHATAYVRTRGYSYPEQIVESERIEQRWYRTVQGWFVDWDREAALEEKPTE